MDSKERESQVMTTYVNRCIDIIINRELIDEVTDMKSFADFTLKSELDEECLKEGIRKGAEIAFDELSNEEKKILERLSCESLYDKENPMGGVTRRYYEKEKWFPHLVILLFSMILSQFKQGV